MKRIKLVGPPVNQISDECRALRGASPASCAGGSRIRQMLSTSWPPLHGAAQSDRPFPIKLEPHCPLRASPCNRPPGADSAERRIGSPAAGRWAGTFGRLGSASLQV